MIHPGFPLVELHRHLDGNVRLQTILDLARRHNLPLPAQDIEGLRPYVQVSDPQPGVLAFFEKFHWLLEVMVDYDACRRIAYENVEDAHNEGIDYIELRFSPFFMAERHQLDPAEVVAAVADGVRAGSQRTGVKTNLIGILSRTYGPEAAWKELGALLAHRDHIRALDLAGDEENWPAELFEPHFRRAAEAGWQITVHAGESAGPESIWKSIRLLGATRIGHAVCAPQDPALMQYLLDNRIGIESCLTSNVQTSTVPTYPAHPLRLFLEKGLLATINSDDPGISAIDLRYEYETAAVLAGLTPQMAHQAQRNALAVAFLSPAEKEALAALSEEQKPR